METVNLSSVLPRGSEASPDGHLILGGCDAVELADRHGTPCYVMVESELRERAAQFLSALESSGVKGRIMFASKACPVAAVCRVFAGLGLGCDVTSGGELRIALHGGMAPEDILFHGNAKSDRELREAIAIGVGLIVIDSADEVDRVSSLASADGRVQKVLLRVAPGVEGDTIAAISTGQEDTKFGVNLVDAPDVIDAISSAGSLELEGLHVHIGSQLGDTDAIRRAAEAIAPLGHFPTVNLGGGLGVAYLDGDADGDIEAFVAGAAEAARAAYGPDVRLLLEPGRALTATAGVTLYSVSEVKRNVSLWVAVDGGISDNIRPLAYGAKYEAISAARLDETADVKCRLAGKHCESGDEIVRDAVLPDPRRGDLIAVPVTGAYGHSMASNYNGALRPPIVMVDGGSDRVVLRRETYGDLLAREVGDPAIELPDGDGR